METITLSPKQQEIQAFVKKYQSQLLPARIHIFNISSGWIRRRSVSLAPEKFSFKGQKLLTTLAFFGHQPDKSSSSSASQNFALIGTDEVGNGSYFGGLAVVASFVTPDQHDFLRKLGVGDSKTLNDSKIRQLAPVLKEKIAIKHCSYRQRSTTKSSLLATTLSLSR